MRIAVLERHRDDDVPAGLEVHLERAQREAIVQRRIGLTWELRRPEAAARLEEVRARRPIAVSHDEPYRGAPGCGGRGGLRLTGLGNREHEQQRQLARSIEVLLWLTACL